MLSVCHEYVVYKTIRNDGEGVGLRKLRNLYHELSPKSFKKICRGGPDFFLAGLNGAWGRAVLAFTDGVLSGFCFTGEPEKVGDIRFIEILYIAAAKKGDGVPLLNESERAALADPSLRGFECYFKVRSANKVSTLFYERQHYKMWNREANMLLKEGLF
jgi:GNAT superfamily N-acetyltransferase